MCCGSELSVFSIIHVKCYSMAQCVCISSSIYLMTLNLWPRGGHLYWKLTGGLGPVFTGRIFIYQLGQIYTLSYTNIDKKDTLPYTKIWEKIGFTKLHLESN